jgi:hypothetical protein
MSAMTQIFVDSLFGLLGMRDDLTWLIPGA